MGLPSRGASKGMSKSFGLCMGMSRVWGFWGEGKTIFGCKFLRSIWGLTKIGAQGSGSIQECTTGVIRDLRNRLHGA